MRLGTFADNRGRVFPGLCRCRARDARDEVFDLSRGFAEIRREGGFPDLKTLLATEGGFAQACAGRLRSLLAAGEKPGPSYPLQELQVLAPVLNPAKIICIGLNYLDHALESGAAVPEEPVIFTKFATAIVGPGAPIVLPPITKEVDYEAELAVIIGKKGKNVPEEEAMQYVAGYTVFNDVSARDLQFRDGQWTKGKTLDTFAPMGPYLVTADEVGDPHRLAIKLWLNDRLMQDSSTEKLIFKIPVLISFLSQLFTLEPGDIIATGTPPGVGFARKPPVFLKPGDTVRITIEKVGTLVNPVAAGGSLPLQDETV
ncbi:MAG: fumarylacetoacetate hydrolase family protein [Firmicutes bacterium]|nr:fumarylacetoacetate hydrolase family protein [Bacillota bacterium]